ncbi:MAG: hypothetical protein M0R76_09540 [Proteobacteria bacterium]|nr:hypothetical protein [Pseudomonadota bacterium]
MTSFIHERRAEFFAFALRLPALRHFCKILLVLRALNCYIRAAQWFCALLVGAQNRFENSAEMTAGR